MYKKLTIFIFSLYSVYDKNYNCQNYYISHYVVNYININVKATCSGLRVSFIIIERIRKMILSRSFFLKF